MDRLAKKGMQNVKVVAGGSIPEDDSSALEKIGIKAVFGPGTKTADIVEAINKLVREK